MKRRATTAFCPPDRLLSDLVTAVPVKETLTISLRITAKNGRELPSSVYVPRCRPS